MPKGMRNPRGRDLSTPLAPTGDFDKQEVSDSVYFAKQSLATKKGRASMTEASALKALSSIESMKD